jgi:hypothetical protein
MTELRQREPREENAAYLQFVRLQPCLICSGRDVQAAHIRMACAEVGKRPTGGGEKSSDRWALPLCVAHHAEQHDHGSEILFWNKYRLDPFAIATRTYTSWKDTQDNETSGKRQKGKSRSCAVRTQKLQASTGWAKAASAQKLPAKSCFPQRHGTLKSRNNLKRS